MLKKIFHYSSYIFFLPISFIFFLVIRLVFPIKVFRFAIINSHRLGHFALEWELFFQLNIQKKYNVILLSFHKDISNNFLAKMIGRKSFIFPAKLIRLIQFFNNSIFGNVEHEFKFHDLINKTKFNKQNILKNYKPSLKFTKNEIIYGNDILKSFNQKKIVGIIVRDEKYLSLKNKFSDIHNARNSNIDDFILGIKYLEKKVTRFLEWENL